MFRHASTPRLRVIDALGTQPIDLFVVVQREAGAWPRTHHLFAALAFTYTNEYYNPGSRGYQHSFVVNTVFHFSSSSAAGVPQKHGGVLVEQICARADKKREGLEERIVLLYAISTLHL